MSFISSVSVSCPTFRFTQQVIDEETSSKDAFLERCLHNPSIRDRFPILSHSYENRKKVCVLQYLVC